MLNPDDMRARFKALGAERDALLAKLEPDRKERDRLWSEVEAIQAKRKALTERMKADNDRLAQIDNERGALARALNGKTG